MKSSRGECRARICESTRRTVVLKKSDGLESGHLKKGIEGAGFLMSS